MPKPELLFAKAHVIDLERAQKSALQNEIANYSTNELLNTSMNDLVEYFVKRYTFDVPTLSPEETVASQKEAHVDMSHDIRYRGGFDDGPIIVAGATVEISIPFSGDRDFFFIQPNPFSMNSPRAIVSRESLVLQFTGVNQKPEQLKQRIDGVVSDIETYLRSLRGNVTGFNSTLRALVTQQLEARKKKLLNDQNLVESLGFNLKKNPDSEKSFTPPSVRRKIVAKPPKANSTDYVPEPALPDQDFDHILSVIQNMAQVMERSPAAFRNMDEEALRTHFLVQLNGHFEGQATGETFNYSGKTDILIRENEKNIFIGECKFWGGPKMFSSTIDQLLGYSSWRDTKVALLIFNRNKDFTNTIKAAHNATEQHENCKKLLSLQQSGRPESRDETGAPDVQHSGIGWANKPCHPNPTALAGG